MRLLLTRPQDDSRPVALHLERLGHEVLQDALLRVVWRDGPVPDLAGVQGLLFTSANGVRAFARLCPARGLPVGLVAWAVGDATAAAARAAGFDRVVSAAGDVEALAGLVVARCRPDDGDFLHPAASAVAGDLSGRLGAAGFAVRRLVLYETTPATALSPATREALAEGRLDAVLVYSPRTARTLVALVQAAGLTAACARVRVLCLSPAVAAALAELPWRTSEIAASPDQAALLALLTAPPTRC